MTRHAKQLALAISLVLAFTIGAGAYLYARANSSEKRIATSEGAIADIRKLNAELNATQKDLSDVVEHVERNSRRIARRLGLDDNARPLDGAVGAVGSRGAAGRAGRTGPAGQTGNTGARGPAGRPARGPRGRRGPRGPIGPAGPAGAPGTPGPIPTTNQIVAALCTVKALRALLAC